MNGRNRHIQAGIIRQISETEQKTERFRVRKFVLEIVEGKYHQYPEFQVTQDGCEFLDQFHPGEQVVVRFQLRGREWEPPQGETRFFTNLEATDIDPVTDAAAPTAPPTPAPPAAPQEARDDDVPF